LVLGIVEGWGGVHIWRRVIMQGGYLLGFEQRKKKLSFLWFVVLLFLWELCALCFEQTIIPSGNEGRMPEGVNGFNFMNDRLFSLCFTSFSLMLLNTRCRSLSLGMMKINKDLVSDEVWQLYVSCRVCICNSKILDLKF